MKIASITLIALFASQAWCQDVRVNKGAEIHLDTPEAHIVVLPPVNRWNPSNNQQEDSLKWTAQKPGDREVRFAWVPKNGDSSFYTKASDHPLLEKLFSKFSQIGLESVPNPFRLKLSYSILGPLVDLNQEQLTLLQDLQKEDFVKISKKLDVERYADPSFLKRVAQAGTGFVVGSALMPNGASIVDKTLVVDRSKETTFINRFDVPESAGLPSDLKLAPSRLPSEYDFSKFSKIQYRNINLFVRAANKQYVSAGEIYIAYKVPKTPELELELEAKALVLALGFDQAPEVIHSVRDEELNQRKTILNECVSSGTCVLAK